MFKNEQFFSANKLPSITISLVVKLAWVAKSCNLFLADGGMLANSEKRGGRETHTKPFIQVHVWRGCCILRSTSFLSSLSPASPPSPSFLLFVFFPLELFLREPAVVPSPIAGLRELILMTYPSPWSDSARRSPFPNTCCWFSVRWSNQAGLA